MGQSEASAGLAGLPGDLEHWTGQPCFSLPCCTRAAPRRTAVRHLLARCAHCWPAAHALQEGSAPVFTIPAGMVELWHELDVVNSEMLTLDDILRQGLGLGKGGLPCLPLPGRGSGREEHTVCF